MTTLIVKNATIDWSRARKHLEKVKKARRSIVTAGGYELLEAANETVPREDDDLADSGFVEVDDGGNVVVAYSAPYALRQHEIPMQHQGNGRMKWLELAAQEQADRVAARMAATAKEEI